MAKNMDQNVDVVVETVETEKVEIFHDITSASEYLGLGDFRMRMIVRQGLVKSVKQPVSKGSKVQKWVIPQSELDSYKVSHRRGFDGTYLYKIKLTEDQVKLLEVFLTENKIETQLNRVNPNKTEPETN